MSANERQVDGDHYKSAMIEHWDFAASQEFDYFQGQITKYVTRWRKKNGIKDLEKAQHFLEKYIEVEKVKLRGSSFNAIANNAMKKLNDKNPLIMKLSKEHLQDLGYNREMPPKVDNTGQKHPFGYNEKLEVPCGGT